MSIIQKVLNDYQLQSLNDSQLMLDIVAHHHEMLDGSGYPAGLKGDEISIVGRIITVADIFDALTSRRPYKEPWPIADALEELDTLVDRGKLDPDCVAALKSHRAEIENLVTQLAD